MKNGGDLTQASTNFGSGAGSKLPFVYLGLKPEPHVQLSGTRRMPMY